MRFAEPSENPEHDAPDDNEEGDDKEQNLPLGYWDVPEETPVTAVRLYMPISQSINEEKTRGRTPLSQ